MGNAGVIVRDHHIIDIYYSTCEVSEHCNSMIAEATAIRNSVKYVKSKYNTENILVYSDCRSIKPYLSEKYSSITRWVKGHVKVKDRKLKHKFNCLADYIAVNGDSNWKNRWNEILTDKI